jgi:hypothetical protein
MHDVETIASEVLPNIVKDLARSKALEKHSKHSASAGLGELMVKIEGSPTALKAAQQVADSPENTALQMVLKMELVDILAENRDLAEYLYLLYCAPHYTGAPQDVEAAAPLLNIMIVLVGILGLLITGGGIYAIIMNALSETKIHIAGMSISTGHVGVAFVGLGIIMVIIVFRQILSIIFKLAELPNDRPRKKSRPRKTSRSRK